MKIIIADDHILLMDALASNLNSKYPGAEIAKVENKKDLFEKLASFEADILLQDVRFGEEDARNFIPEISIKYICLKIIVFTSIPDVASLKKMCSLPIHALVSKSEPLDEIFNAISSLKTNQIFISQSLRLKMEEQSFAFSLSPREMDVLREISKGKTSKQIAEQLFISEKTVEMHRSNLFSKLEVSNVLGLVKKALSKGLIEW